MSHRGRRPGRGPGLHRYVGGWWRGVEAAAASRSPGRRRSGAIRSTIEALEARRVLTAGSTSVVLPQASLAPAEVGTSWDVQLQSGDAQALSSLLPAIAAAGATIGATPVPGLYVVQGPVATMGALGRELAASPGVAYAGAEHLVSDATLPNDPDYTAGRQWQLNGTWGINAPAAWSVTTGSTGVIVADTDTGINYNAADMANNLWLNQAEIPAAVKSQLADVNGDGLITFADLNNPANQGAGKILDVNGDGLIDGADVIASTSSGGWASGSTQDGATSYPDDLIGWNFVNNTNNPWDDDAPVGHGTFTAGEIGAVGDNGLAGTGVEQVAQVMPVKFLDSGGSGTSAAASAAIHYAVDHGARVINASWGGSGTDDVIQAALQYAGQHGVIVVCAAGNNGADDDTSFFAPASYSSQDPNVISVAATGGNGLLAPWSNFGTGTVQIAAPGDGVFSLTYTGSDNSLSGTSMAAPMVAGTVALVEAAHPSWSMSQVIDAVLDHTTPNASLVGRVTSGGIVNAGAAVSNTDGPHVVSLTGAGSVAAVGGLTGLTVAFNEEVDPSTVTAALVTVSGPNGPIGGFTVSPVAGSNDHKFTISFPAQFTPGTYSLTVAPAIRDWYGNAMNQDRNGVNGEPSDGYAGSIQQEPVLTFSGLPATAPVGQPVSFTVTVGTADGVGNASYVGTIQLASNDPLAVLPPSYTFTATDAGTHTFTVTFGTAGAGVITAFDPATPSVVATRTVSVGGPSQASAALLNQDAATAGGWIGTYGAQGADVIGITPSLPAYATITPSGQFTWTWAASTTDARAPQVPGGSTRVAAAWYSSTSFTVDVNLADTNAHDLELYLLDWDKAGRTETVQISDAASGSVLSTQAASSFGSGVYLDYQVSGHVKVTITNTGPQNAVLSGLFLDPTTPRITWPAPASVAYGTPLSSAQLDATASAPGTFTYGPASGTVLGVGTQALSATFTPIDTSVFSKATATTTIVITQATPSITWPGPASIVYGTPLSSSQLDATASVPGTFAYSPAAGTVLGAGTDTLSVTFTPTDSADYKTVTATTTIVVAPATPGIVWANPAGIVYGTPLSTAQLDATASVPGTFAYTPAAGTILAAGNQTLSVAFTPADSTDYQGVTATVTIAVAQATPAITWANPADIRYGTPLSSAQLDATASVPGTFTYSPAAGTVLGAGNNQVLSATFTPDDSADYRTVAATASINVLPAASSATFLKEDSGTGGTWNGTYGGQGYEVIGGSASLPSYATVTPSGQSSWTWASPTTDARALQTAAGSSARTAATWYSATGFTVDVNLTDGQAHDLGLYLLDWDDLGRSETVQISDPSTGSVLSTQSVASFSGGVYLDYQVGGHVKVTITNTGPQNAVLSGLFLDPTAPPAATATFVKQDTTTRGGWNGTYGGQGYEVMGGSTSLPNYAMITPSGQSPWTWASSTTDARALQTAAGSSARAAATWYSATSFSVDVSLGDGNTHDLELYLLDWDSLGRSETVQISDPSTGSVLSTQSVASFSGGVYLDYQVGGHVRITITNTGPQNAVLGGLFLDPTTPPPPATATFVKQDATTQGTWSGTYGNQGNEVIGGSTSLPSYATVAPSGQSSWTWQSSTTDPRALQTASGSSARTAATWYSTSSFSVDVSLGDGQAHNLELYLLDWDDLGRTQTVQVSDAGSGAVLSTQTASSFGSGVYLDYQVSGHIRITITNGTGSRNAVLSGLFLG